MNQPRLPLFTMEDKVRELDRLVLAAKRLAKNRIHTRRWKSDELGHRLALLEDMRVDYQRALKRALDLKRDRCAAVEKDPGGEAGAKSIPEGEQRG